MTARAGDPRQALALWTEIAEDPSSDPASVAIAKRRSRELKVRVDLEQLAFAIARFERENLRWPLTLAELVSGGYVSHLPSDPDGGPYVYDPLTGRVSSTAGRLLGDAS